MYLLLLWEPGYHGNCLFVYNLFHKQKENLLTIKMIPCLLKLAGLLLSYNIFPACITSSLHCNFKYSVAKLVYPQQKYGISRVKCTLVVWFGFVEVLFA